MASKKFDLGDVLAPVLKASDSDTAETLQHIDINLLDSDERNFYALDGIDELAANIELIGLQQPIRVRANPDMPGRYFIVSGHRRRAALWKLYEEQPEKWGMVPCIVETDAVSPAMQELRLIYANADTRRMKDADLAKQAERVTELLYQLKEEGVEFPGRMRDHVAEACKVSATKLATLKVIREKLLPPFSEQFSTGELSTQAAYALARLSEKSQKLLAESIGKKIIYGSAAENTLKNEAALLSNHERHKCPSGTTCQNTAGFLIGSAAAQYTWNSCEGERCCINCHHSESCPGRCQTCRDKQKERNACNKKAEEKRKAKEEKERAERQNVLKNASVAAAKRMLKAADAAGLDDKTEIPWDYSYCKKSTVSDVRKTATGGLKQDYYFYKTEFIPVSVEALVSCSNLLHCSTDFLLGLTDELQPTAPAWQTGEPTEAGLYWCRFDCSGAIVEMAAEWVINTMRWVMRSSRASVDADCLSWHKLPEV